MPGSLRPPSRSHLSWRCTRRTTPLKSHPSASLPRVPETGRAAARRNAPGPRGAPGSERPNLLAGGGGGGSVAPGVALGDRALEGGPGRPAPSPPPHGGRQPCGAPTRPLLRLRRRPPRSWGGAPARPRGQVALRAGIGLSSGARSAAGAVAASAGSPGAREPASQDLRPEGGAGGGWRPPVHRLQPRRAGLAAAAASVSALRWGLPKLPPIIPAEKNRGALASALFSGENPDGEGATERAQRLPGNN